MARVEVLRGVDLCIAPGEVVGIVGGSGAGKSTLLLCAAGLLRVDRGSITSLGVAGPPGHGVAMYLPASSHVVPTLPGPGAGGPRLLLFDDGVSMLGDRAPTVLRALARRGLAIVLTAREATAFAAVATRMLVLEGGRLQPRPPVRIARVAEGAIS
jgi:ABC-type methionine transport system ATPase subunit